MERIEGIPYGTSKNRRLVHPNTGKSLSQQDAARGVQGIPYSRWHNNRLVDPNTGKTLSEQNRARGIQGISYCAWRNQRLVHPNTGEALSEQDRAQGIQGISHNIWYKQRLVHPNTGKFLNEENIAQGIEGIPYSTWQNQKLVHPNTGKLLSEQDRAQGIQGIPYSAWKYRKLVHPYTGKLLSEQDRAQGIQGIPYSAWKRRKLVEPLVSNEITPWRSIVETPAQSCINLHAIAEAESIAPVLEGNGLAANNSGLRAPTEGYIPFGNATVMSSQNSSLKGPQTASYVATAKPGNIFTRMGVLTSDTFQVFDSDFDKPNTTLTALEPPPKEQDISILEDGRQILTLYDFFSVSLEQEDNNNMESRMSLGLFAEPQAAPIDQELNTPPSSPRAERSYVKASIY